MTDIIQWLITVGTNDSIYKFVDNNSLILLACWATFIAYLKYQAKKTPSPEDDKFVEDLDNEVRARIGGIFEKIKK